MTMPTDYSQQLLAYLQAWRQVLEQVTPMVPGLSSPPAMPGMPPAMPGMPPVPPTPPAGPTPPMPPSPADYTQQLLAYLQAWRRYLEQATGPATGPPPPHTPASGEQKEVPRRPAHSDVGRGGRVLHSGSGSEAGFQPPDPSTVRVPEPSAVRGPEPAGSKVYKPPGDTSSSSDNSALRVTNTSVWPPEVFSRPGDLDLSFFDRTRRRPIQERPAQGPERLVGSPHTGPASPKGSGASYEITIRSLYSKATYTRPTTPWATGSPRRGAVMPTDAPEAKPKVAKPKEKEVPKPPGNIYGHQA